MDTRVLFVLRRLVVPLRWGWEFETCNMRREKEMVVMGKMKKKKKVTTAVVLVTENNLT